MPQPNDNQASVRVRADFNGVFSQVLCLSHKDTAPDQNGNPVVLKAGMLVTAYDDDIDEEGKPDALIATGIVEPSPAWLRCRGSRWVLRFNESGVQHESDLRKTE